MSYQTILVHVDQSSHAQARMRYAAALAQAHGAHLLGAAMLGVSRAVFPEGYRAAPGTLEASYFEPLADNAGRALNHFASIAGSLSLPYTGRFICDQADDGLARMARFADLVVLSQDDPDEAMPDLAVHLPEYVILNCARPVLVLPRNDVTPYAGHKVLVAWDGSKEASCALTAALPMLRHADAVHVAAMTGADGDKAALQAQWPDLLDFLERHRVKADVTVREPRQEVGRALLALAAELQCGMLVMGCYGHGRLRELCLGGASRTVLAEATIAVLMAH